MICSPNIVLIHLSYILLSILALSGLSCNVSETSSNSVPDTSEECLLWSEEIAPLVSEKEHMERIGGVSGINYAVESGPGDIIFASFGSIVNAFDVTTPFSPQLVGSFLTTGKIHALRYLDGLLYIGNGYTGLVIIDVTDPEQMTYVGHLDTAGFTRRLAVKDGLAFLPDDDALRIADIQDPQNPKLISEVSLDGSVYAVSSQGSHAYVVTADGKFFIFDVSDPSNPKELGKIEEGWWSEVAYDVDVEGNFAFVATHGAGLAIIDVSDPASPELFPLYWDVLDENDYARALGVRVEGNTAYVTLGPSYSDPPISGGLMVVDVTDPSSPKTLGVAHTAPDSAVASSVKNNVAFVANDDAGLRVIDLDTYTALESPVLPSSVVYDIDIDGTYLYMADYYTGLLIADMSQSEPKLVGTWYRPDYNDTKPPESASSRAIVVQEGRAYLTMGSDGLYVIDVQNPSAPELLGGYVSSGEAKNLKLAHGLAFLSTDTEFLILNVGDPANIVEVGRYVLPEGSWTYDFFVNNGIAYLSGDQLRILDISQPSNPILLTTMDVCGIVRDLFVSGSLLVVACHDNSLFLLDVSDPINPKTLSSFTIDDSDDHAASVSIQGDLACVGYDSSGVRLVDIANPTAPNLVGYWNNGEPAVSCMIHEDVVFVAGGDTGLWVVSYCATN